MYVAGIAAIELSSAWLALGCRLLWLRVVLVTTAVLVVAFSTRLALDIVFLPPVPWYIATSSVVAALMVGSLLILRIHGYRLINIRSITTVG